jgi:hypothetical protein
MQPGSPDIVELDLRGLPAPEPMLRALVAADALAPGAAVSVLTPLVPLPLLDALRARGLRHCVEALPGGGARVLIQHPAGHGTTGD